MGIKERQDRERQAVAASIMDAAREIFVAEGYLNVSIRKIAERIEYSPAAIYSYFPSKDDIFLALAEEGFHRLDAKVQGTITHADPVEDVRNCWWAFYEFSKEQPEFFELMFVDRSVPRITQQWEGFEFLQQLLTNAVTCIQKAIDAGGFPATLNPHVAMHILWGALIGPAVVGIRHRLSSGEDYDALARDVLATTIAGLQTGVKTTFVPCECADEGIVGVSVPVGARNHES
ncbi:MAG: TetR/AcrR family transcriptional regulator [Vicinamibacterales bacterium]